ncbi:MAG: M23 family metallopeptidase [Lachnospiraceae bacterium]|nr:M23 family metallopeptidase [Lachnospiraceae bacterium]
MRYIHWMKKAIVLEMFLLAVAFTVLYGRYRNEKLVPLTDVIETTSDGEEFIKWVDFKVSYEALCAAYEWDVATYGQKIHIEWIPLLAYTAARNGGEFDKAALNDLQKAGERIASGETSIDELTVDLKYYSYYLEAYEAVLGGFVGEYQIEAEQENGELIWEEKYGLKAFLPIAKGFPYQDYDDFGASRSYGYDRQHLGHDMMGQVGTPIVAVESGYVEALGWNQYGGWRIGIRSFDKKRYYYYAHLRQNFPYCKTLEEGSVVTAGDVIGYMGHTGYSIEENVNNIDTVHLHFGMQLIFDESQKESNNEIWIDCYALTKFLYKNRSLAQKDTETKEWYRVYQMKDPMTEKYRKQSSASGNSVL